MKRTLLTIGLSAMLALPMLAAAQRPSTTSSARGDTGYSSGVGSRMETHGQQAMGAQEVREAQKQLKEAGFNPGPIDGQLGQQTHQAIREYQKENGLPQTGQLDEPTKELLMAERTQPSSERMNPLPGSTPGRSMGSESSRPGTMGGSESSR